MDNQKMACRLTQAGVQMASGLSQEQLDRAEQVFGFRFPGELRAFFGTAYPTHPGFFDYRDLSEENLLRFEQFQEKIRNSFLFDLQHNTNDLAEELGLSDSETADRQQLEDVIVAQLRHSTRLIPLYRHRCFFDGMDDMPIVSFWQATDVILYGKNLEHYLEKEFLSPSTEQWELNCPRLADTGIWGKLIC